MKNVKKSEILAKKAEAKLQIPDLAIEPPKIKQHFEYLIRLFEAVKRTKYSIN